MLSAGKKKILGGTLIALIALLVLLASGFVIYAKLKTAAPEPEALAALDSTSEVQVTTDDWLVFKPTAASPDSGLVIYPGGFVDPRAYAPVARDIAAQGFLVVIVPMPLNLAVFGAGKASDVIRAFPEIETWAIAGHSLGGAMASRYAHQNPTHVDGLALWAAFPAGSDDLSQSYLTAVSLYGTQDGLVSLEEIENSRRLLPPDARFVAIEGGNHAQFGWYGPQDGDLPATISHDEQQAQIVVETVALLQRISAESRPSGE